MKKKVISFIKFFINSITLIIIMIAMSINLIYLKNFSSLYLIIIFGINILGLGLNNDSKNGNILISFAYGINIVITFLLYFSVNSFRMYGTWLSMSRAKSIIEFNLLNEDLYLIFALVMVTSIAIFFLKAIIYFRIQNKENTNFYAGLLIFSTTIFMYLFERISQESNNWSYFISIGSFLLLFFDYNIFVSAFGKYSQKEMNSKYGKKLSFNIKRKFARIKLIISASSIIAIISVIFKKPGKVFYEIALKNNLGKTSVQYDNFGILLYTLILIMLLFIYFMVIFYAAKSYKVRHVMKKKKLEGKENQQIIWNNTWRIKNSMKRIPFLEDIVEFYEYISSDAKKCD